MELGEKIGTVITSCGACKNNILCDNCKVCNMNANGLPKEWANELDELSISGNWSQVYSKILELKKQFRIR